jgi:hypothetical protein
MIEKIPHIFRQAFIIYDKYNIGGFYMSRRRSDDIFEELIERIERLEELLNNRRDDRFDNRGNNINPNNDWCPGCSNDCFCNNNDDDNFDCCSRHNRRNRSR